ncbi:MAG: glutamate--tRNA ligase [Deltaproteobacteria bacterium RIFCSPLOWO2_12_FULL_60_19]|nr:MAG: glutamate--tRNA ligase [Deltaproteobacteria bacterium RIFCSPLOWO2_12_FULL_60_19]
MPSIRTRFAPSPTGYLHIGGARTALFNYLFARHHGGKFILRIEDTDRERSTPEAIAAIVDSLKWLGLEWDEGPFYQTERYPLYKEKVQQLLAAGKAYPCTCAPEELDAKRQAALKEKRKPGYDGTCRPKDGSVPPLPQGKPYTVRFLSPKTGATVVEDGVKGNVVFENLELDDLIVARSDGSPTYNFCVVVDDLDMGITDIIRGDDHLSNTPRQILLYQALGRTPPRFAHVPLILGIDKARLSKRHGATSVTAYRDMGYFPEALVNYLVRLGWSHGDQEIFSRDELIEKFTLENVGKSAGVFNPEKFLWLNSHYMKNRPLLQLADEILPFIEAKGYPRRNDREWLAKMIRTLTERAKTLVELVEMARFYLSDDIQLEEKAAKKFLTPEVSKPLNELSQKLAALDDFTEPAIEQTFTAILQEKSWSLGKLAQPVRVALTGSTTSPGIYEVIAVLGKERTVQRLRQAVDRIPRP